MTSFLDQSQLLDLAERLVNAAKRAGADAADAVAVRSISLSVEVRDGAVEESERAGSCCAFAMGTCGEHDYRSCAAVCLRTMETSC